MNFIPDKTLVHVAGQVFDWRERRALIQLAESGLIIRGDEAGDPEWQGETAPLRLTAGIRHHRLEVLLAKRFGVKHAVLVNSGSSANLIAFESLRERYRIPRGSKILTVACAFPTTVAPIVQAGCIPVFVDVDLDGNVDRDAFLDVLDRAPTDPRHPNAIRGIVLAHALGFPFDLDVVRGAACGLPGQEPIPLLADCCDAAGAQWRGKEVTSQADVATLSFYPAHHMTTGEGGCVLTDDDEIAKVARSLRDWGRDCTCPPDHDNTCGARFEQDRATLGNLPDHYDHKYVYSRLGYNLKMIEPAAAVGLVQLDKLDGFIARRRATWGFYRVELDGLDPIVFPQWAPTPGVPHPGDASPFGFLMLSPDRDRIVRELEKRRIQTRPLFAGNLLRHPCMRDVAFELGSGVWTAPVGRAESPIPSGLPELLPNTERLMREAFWIGVYPGVTDEMREWVVKSLREIVG